MKDSPKLVLAAGLLLLSSVLGACADSTTPHTYDGQSHWLQECGSDSDCGPLECICGTCTLKCTKADECKPALGNDVMCTSATNVAEAMCDEGSKPRICAPKGGSAPGPDGGSKIPEGDSGSKAPDGGGEAAVEPQVTDGDGTCSKGETPETAPMDCQEAGDGLCTGGENVWNAPGDCGTIQRVSVKASGAQLDDGASYPKSAISTDGSRVAFEADKASSEDLNRKSDIYVMDLKNAQLILATPRMPDIGIHKGVFLRAMTDDGSWVVFETLSPDFVVSDTNNRYDVYVANLDSGEIIRVSLQPSGTQYTEDCASAGVTRDSRFVQFSCGNGGAAAAYDLQTREIVDATDLRAGPTFDATGTLEVFGSSDPLLADDTNDRDDIYLRNHSDGSLERISVRPDGIEASGSSWFPSISRDGRFVAFASAASNLTPDPNDVWDAFVHDRVSGENLRVSVQRDGSDASRVPSSGGFSSSDGARLVHRSPQVSGNGRYVTFYSEATNLVDGDTNDSFDVFLVNIGDWVDSLPPAN